jgi:DUF1680 family protein
MTCMTRRQWLQSAAALPLGGARFGVPPQASARGQGILDLTRSPHAKLRNVPVRAVTIDDGFWAPRRRVNVEDSIPSMIELLEQNGIVDNFRRLSGKKQAPIRGPVYTDSDLYKWMEAAAFVLQSADEPRLRKLLDSCTDEIVAAQEPSGYLHTHLVGERAAERFQRMDSNHELYCLGHLLQAAIACQRATGGTRLLDVGLKYVNYLERDFGFGKQPLLTGHPELEMALVELHRTTGDFRHLDLAGYLLHGDGERLKLKPAQMVYMFSGKPFTSRTRLEGHAVRAMYACCGAADYYLETGNPAYWQTLERLWDDMTRSKMYVTGGVGSRSEGEAFGEPFELPNRLAYTESCAAIGNLMWNWRLLAATGDARYTDVLERALYNGVNSGMSLSGRLYCYRNPLELSGDPEDRIRNPWYDTTCCPPNLERVLASLPGYLYGTSAEGVYVHLYHASRLDWRLEDGMPLRLEQATKYPWAGEVELRVDPAAEREFTLFLRIPGWTRSPRVTVNGRSVPGAVPGRYLALRRRWAAGDRVELAFDVRPRVIAANPRVTDDIGKVAVQRGPLVYCLEGLDQPGADSLFDVALPLPSDPDAGFREEWRPDLLGGIVALKHKGVVSGRRSADLPLYQPLAPAAGRETELTFIPYYAFANREPTPMQVWVPRTL